MSLFAPFSSERPDLPRLPADPAFEIRDAAATDVEWLAALSAERNGRTLAAAREGMTRRLTFVDAVLLVAVLGEVPLGYAGAQRLDPPPQPDGSETPAGWYLTGLVVVPTYRRHGVGAALTSARLVRVPRGAAYCFMSDANRASVVLHERLGFERVRSGFVYPGVAFTGGSGALYRVEAAGGD